MRLIRRLLALGVGLLVGLLAVEVGLRVAGIEAPRLSGRGTAVDEEAYAKEVNSFLFHDDEWEVERPAGTFRVIALGDSFTEGRKVPRDELFVQRIERSLDAECGERRVEVLNMARSGWGTVEEVGMLEGVLSLGADPHAVLIVFFINDANRIPTNLGLVRSLKDEVHGREGVLNRVLRSWDYLDYLRRRDRVTRRTVDEYRRSVFGSEEETAVWVECQAALARAAELAREHEFALGVVVFPVLFALDDRHPLQEVYAEVVETCHALGIPARDLLEPFLGREARALWCDIWDAHPNAEANGLVAPAIEAFLREEVLPSDFCSS